MAAVCLSVSSLSVSLSVSQSVAATRTSWVPPATAPLNSSRVGGCSCSGLTKQLTDKRTDIADRQTDRQQTEMSVCLSVSPWIKA